MSQILFLSGFYFRSLFSGLNLPKVITFGDIRNSGNNMI